VGFWGTVLVCRGSVPVDELAAVAERSEGITEHRWLPGGWQLARYDGDELAEDVPELLGGLFAETGQPALAAFVMDDDTASVEGVSVAGRWCACLVRDPMANHCEDEGVRFSAAYLRPRAAARAAAAWARAATGADPDPARLRELFAVRDCFSAEGLLDDLLSAMGVF
jgi:hypothetical protein